MNAVNGRLAYGNEGASVNGKPPVSKTGTAGSIPAAPGFLRENNRNRSELGMTRSKLSVSVAERVADPERKARRAPIPAAPVVIKRAAEQV